MQILQSGNFKYSSIILEYNRPQLYFQALTSTKTNPPTRPPTQFFQQEPGSQLGEYYRYIREYNPELKELLSKATKSNPVTIFAPSNRAFKLVNLQERLMEVRLVID